jgi:hypothetical protein
MNRKIAIAVVAILLAVAVDAVVWSTREPEIVTGPALPTFDYATEDSWAVRPDAPPPAVWESGWDIDVLLLDTAAALEVSDDLTLEKRRDEAAERLEEVASAFESIGPVYAPYIRAASLDEDITAALSRYVADDNRGRAFVVAIDGALPATALSPFQSDPLLRDRFGGVLYYGDADDGAVAPADICSRRFKDGESCVEPVELRRAGRRYERSGGERLTNGLVSWLNDHASKLAEPLGELEEIEIIDIRRPGETDEAAEN